ncbi:SPOR domain-containing protein [Limibaculum sp. M0105]|uniref:SPOR domain-containing protein n=1 Tax=Thermohalobaculum xanthum TaxID=2753746 RepID=A0A8J7SAK7_9RHOB|nr:SPOR domain-containing protein [Thermohalobaculum xanthum]MBK0398402.1 SPOR domain-containing protein [Thermohalobaculum xanthum]
MKAYYDDEEDYADALSAAHARGGWRASLSIWAGAAVALALVVGLVYWSWGLATRAPDEVPLIRASASPAKERPADPGGADTPHQNVRAFDAALGQGETAPQVALAPPAPSPTSEDVAMGRLAPRSGSGASTEVVAAVVGGVEEIDERAAGQANPSGPSPLIEAEQALIEESLRRVLADASPGEPSPPAGASSEQAPPYSPGVRGKPRDLAARVASASTVDVDAELRERAATSQIQVQLGAFPDRGEVDREWERIFQANRDILAGRALAVQQTTSGGTVYFRLRVGPFRDGHEANTVCQALKARGQDCLVAINTDRRG